MKNSRENRENHVDILQREDVYLSFWKDTGVFTSFVNPTLCMISFCVLNICRQCLKSARLGKTFPPHGSFRILEKFSSLNIEGSTCFPTGNFQDCPRKNIPMILSPIQRRDNRRNETFVHLVHVEPREIFPRDTHKLSLEINRISKIFSFERVPTADDSTSFGKIQL